MERLVSAQKIKEGYQPSKWQTLHQLKTCIKRITKRMPFTRFEETHFKSTYKTNE